MLQRSHPVSIRSGNTQYYFNSTLLNNKGYYFKIKNIIQEIIPLFVLFFIKLSFFLENYNIYKYSNFIKKNKHNKSKLNFKLLLKNKKI